MILLLTHQSRFLGISRHSLPLILPIYYEYPDDDAAYYCPHQYFTMIQAFYGESFPFSQSELVLPLQLFQLRKQYQGDAKVNAELDQVFDALMNEDTVTA